ncbi:hypothetical protein TH19_17065 [Thalassospira profundimaris]|uniref:Uncharacterized protein n=1 Tax=Thalassospira profundimaris TaxID=502049 RepID=A0A367W1F6_9PROT|nr:hypothetical protein TH19_17065 [Thalassospira profundimaris]
MNIAPKPNASSTFGEAFAGSETGFGPATFATTGFGDSVIAGFAAVTAATFFGAAAFFGALGVAAFLVAVAGLLDVVTVRALSVLAEDTGLGDVATAFAAGGATSDVAVDAGDLTGDLTAVFAVFAGEAVFGLVGDAIFATGEDFGTSTLGKEGSETGAACFTGC